MTRAVLLALVLLFAAPVAAQHNHGDAGTSAPNSVGKVDFANSGNTAAQASFARGLAQLHNFEFDTAATLFREAQATDPGFAMAYWGEAMSYNHPVWFEQDTAAARAVLARLGATPAARAAKAGTAREAAYLGAVEILYGDGEKHARDLRYRDAMLALHKQYPDDVDATAFAALAELGTANQGRDYATYMRAAALLEDVYPTHMTHPGVLHYMIHSYDDPIHAPLGLRPALRYGAVAPDAGHALHMTSHIFLALGMWPQTISANIAAMGAVDRARSAAGKPDAHCGHYADWLTYAYLQSGALAAQETTMAGCASDAQTELARPDRPIVEPYQSAVRSYVEMAARRALETTSPVAGISLPDGKYLSSRYHLLYAQAIATRKSDSAGMAEHAAALARLRAEIDTAMTKLPPDALQYVSFSPAKAAIMAQQVDALVLLAAGKTDAGIAALRKTASAEAVLPVDFGPPEVYKPTTELLGEVLLDAGDRSGAEVEFGKTLLAAPGRRLALAGLAQAQPNQAFRRPN